MLKGGTTSFDVVLRWALEDLTMLTCGGGGGGGGGGNPTGFNPLKRLTHNYRIVP